MCGHVALVMRVHVWTCCVSYEGTRVWTRCVSYEGTRVDMFR